MKNKLFPLLCFSALFFGACSDDETIPTADNPISYTVAGKVEKGPFVSGSAVTLQPVDNNLSATGSIYTTTIKDNEGAFDFSSREFTTPYAQLSTDGYFFNEVEGELSKGPIKLQAIIDLSDNSTVNVNLLTHLKSGRISKLKRSGMSFKDANQQAQRELLTHFALQKYSDLDATKFSITSGTDEAGALIVVSSALLYDRSEAQLTEYLSKINQEFSENGQLSDKIKKDYRETCLKLDLEKISENIIDRYKSLDKTITVKPLDNFIDWDNDGVAGNELGNGQPIEMAFEKDTLFVPTEGGTFLLKVNSNIPFTLTKPNTGGWTEIPPTGTPFLGLLNTRDISFTEPTVDKETGKTITLTIAPAEAYTMNDSTLTIYSYNGKHKSELVIVQKGDEKKPVFSEYGLSVVSEMSRALSSATYYTRVMEALYTNTYKSKYTRDEFETHSLNSNSSVISQAWSSLYNGLSTVGYIRKYLNHPLASNLSVLSASLYYDMAILWENVPYADYQKDMWDSPAIPMNSKDLFKLFEPILIKNITNAEDKKNKFDALDDYFLYSNDFPRAVLAKMYLYQKDYAKAKQLLIDIVTSGHYQLSASRADAMQENSTEMIWGYRNPTSGENSSSISYRPIELDPFLPFATYTEVILSLAECEYHLGDITKANQYLNQVASKRGKSTLTDFTSSLKEIWASELKGTGTYFAFLKRNGLAQAELKIEKYQLVFPIPERELTLNPKMIQNPGY